MMANKVEKTTDQASLNPEKADTKKSAKKTKQPKPQKQSKQTKPDEGLYLPILAEFAYTSAVIFLTLVFLSMAVASWLTGASLLDFVLRTSIAMGVLGMLVMIISRQVSTGVLSISIAEIEEKRQKQVSEELEQQADREQQEEPEDGENSENPEIPTIVEAQ